MKNKFNKIILMLCLIILASSAIKIDSHALGDKMASEMKVYADETDQYYKQANYVPTPAEYADKMLELFEKRNGPDATQEFLKSGCYSSFVHKGQDESNAKKELIKNISNGTTAYGVAAYLGSATVHKGMTELEIRTEAEKAMLSGGSGGPLFCYHLGGSKYKEAFSGSNATAYAKTFGLADASQLDAFIDVYTTYFGGDEKTLDAQMAQLTIGKDATVPVLILVPAFGTANGLTDMYQMKMGSKTVATVDEIQSISNEIYNKINTTMFGSMTTGEGISETSGGNFIACRNDPITGHCVFVKYAIPYFDAAPVSNESTIIGWANPKAASNQWEKKPTTSGIYNVKVTIGETDIAHASEYIKIDIKTDFATGTGPNPVLSAGDIKVTIPGNWSKYATTTSPTNVVLEIPPTKAAAWNASGAITYTVKISGGSDTKVEQSRPFTASATVNGTPSKFASTTLDEKWIASGGGGTTYTSWIGSKEEVVDDSPYDWHTTEVPLGEAVVVANEVNNEDWDASSGIPSTENVSIKAGAQSGMVDLAGYLCARNNDGAASVGDQSSMGEDEYGVEQSDQAVTRTIKIIGSIENCWGGNNAVCQLSKKAIFTKSGGESNADGAGTVYSTGSCSTSHSCKAGGSKDCPGKYDNYEHSASYYICKDTISGSTGWYEYTNEHHDGGGCGGDDEEEKDAAGKGTGKYNCGWNPAHDGSVDANHHDCTYTINIYDSINEDYLGQSMPKSGSASGVNSGDPYGLVQISRGADCGINIHWEISWSPSQDEQYYIVNYKVWNTERSQTSGGCHAFNNSGLGNKSWGASGTTFSGVNSDSVLCKDYTHGTGETHHGEENMVHPGTHQYTITYKETIDAYVYRTITDAQLYALTGITYDNNHMITRDSYTSKDGNEYEAGTFAAPISDAAKGSGVGAPSAVGYIWRCTNSKNGEYKSGNGRIEFEAWKDPYATLNGNGITEFNNPEYYLGDIEVKIIARQDHEWGEGITGEDTWEPTTGTAYKADRGMGHCVHDNGKTTSKYMTTASDTKYKNGNPAGDCTNGNSPKTQTDNEANHATLVRKELTAMLNFWCGKNQADDYHANIISDVCAYGGTEETNDILDDAYTVDEGVALFNVHVTNISDATLTVGGTDDMGSTDPIWRNHKSKYGIDAKELKEQLRGGAMSSATVQDGGTLELFGGVDSYHKGGSVALDATSAGVLKTGNIAALTGKDCQTSKGDSPTSEVYSRDLPYTAPYNSTNSGMTTITVTSQETVSPQKNSQLYWEVHEYKNTGSTQIQFEVTGGGAGGGGGYNNCGDASLSYYGTLAISNLPLVDWTPNGMWFTGQCGSHYVQMNAGPGVIPEPADGWTYREGVSKSHEDIASEDKTAPCGVGGGVYLNQIYIYDPVSSAYDKVIGAQYGKFEDSPSVTDDTKYDQRIDNSGNFYTDMPKSEYQKLDPYVVQSQYLWSWFAPFGDFASADGVMSCSSTNTADTSKSGNGRVTNDGTYSGYANRMQVQKWIATAGLSMPFIAGTDDTTHTLQSNVELSISDMAKTAHGGNFAGSAKDSILPDDYLWGNAYATSDTCNLVEMKKAEVKFYAYGINPFIWQSDSEMQGSCIGGYIEQNDNNTNKKANKTVSTDYVDLVGSIGNVTIHDTTDFRFSNYFKEVAVPTTPLIDGVINKVDLTKPLKVVSTTYDIALNNVVGRSMTKGGVGHATLGNDIYSSESPYYGMGGDFDELPLVPSYNTVSEYKTEALRLGYKVYESVDTIGNYQSALVDGEVRPNGPGDADTRSRYLEVKSTYFLYDLDDGKFYDIDIWSGSTGSKERLYSGKNRQVYDITSSNAIYQNVKEEEARRNIGVTEYNITNSLTTKDETQEEPTYLLSDIHYIGSPGRLKLDNRDVSYIGSDVNKSLGRSWGFFTDAPSDSTNTGQRYHFMDGLTSTSVITKPLGDNPNQSEINRATQEVQERHPHAVIIEFQDFIAKGSIWTIKSKGSTMNNPKITIYDTNGDDPDDPSDDNKYIPHDFDEDKTKEHNTVIYPNAPTYDPVTGTQTGTIDPDSTPIVVQEAYHSSAEDRTVAGTH